MSIASKLLQVLHGYFGITKSGTTLTVGRSTDTVSVPGAVSVTGAITSTTPNMVSAAGTAAVPSFSAAAQTGTDATPLAVVVGGGLGTGAGAGGTLTLATPTTLGTGTTAQTRVARYTISQGIVTTDIATHTVGGIVTQVTGVSATGLDGQKISPTATGGMKTVVVDKTVSPSAVETAVFTVPKGSVILSVQGNVTVALTGGGTTVTWSIGTAGDPDKYGTAGSPTAANALTQNSKSSFLPDRVQLTSDEPIVLTGAATGGTADGDTALTVGSVRVVIVYDTYESLANA